MIRATGITISGMGSGMNRLIAAAMPPRSAAASMVLPMSTPVRVE
jgi:hypothetical protein